MFCPNCGKSLPDGAKFCSGCGTRLDSFYTDTAQTPAPKRAKKRRVWPIILAVVLLAAAVGGFLAYRHYVVKPREATDDLIRCLKKSDAYESAEDFRSRVDDGHYNYYDAVKSDYGKAELADYFDDLFRDEDYHEYIHDASVLIASGYLNSYDYTADQYIKDSALQRLWEMGSAISPDDVSRVTDDSYADDQSGVYFRGVRIEDFVIVEVKSRYDEVRFRVRRFFLDRYGFALFVKLHDAELSRVVHIVSEDGRAICERLYGRTELLSESCSEEDVVSQCEAYRIVSNKIFTDYECVRDASRLFLFFVFDVRSKERSVLKKVLERVYFSGWHDYKDVSYACLHHGRDRIVYERFVIHREQRLAHRHRYRIQSGSFPRCKDYSFHI